MKTISAVAVVLCLTGRVWASDAHNRCAAPNPHIGAAVAIPEDDAVHLGSDGKPSVVYDQWYWNAVLVGDDGHVYGVQTLPFQFYFAPVILDVTQIALTDAATGEYLNQIIFGGDGRGYPYIPDGFDLQISDSAGAFRATGGGGSDDLTLTYADGTVAQIHFESTKNPAPAWADGLGRMIDPITGRDHGTQFYFNRRNMAAHGTIHRPGKRRVNVVGIGWYDREFGSVIGTRGSQDNNVNWRWLSLHLSDDTDYMMWDMYANDTGNNLLHYVNEIAQAPACTEKTITAFTFTPSSATVSADGPPASRLHLGGHLSIPEEGLELDVHLLRPNQIVTSGGLFSPFFEAAFVVSGTRHGRLITGTGYFEEFVSPRGCCQ
jgi:predicted secreted hydrolase